MRITLFSAEQATRMVRELRPAVEQLVASKRELDALDTRIDALRIALAGASADNPDAFELAGATEQRRRIAARIGEGVSRIHRQGVLVKDLDRGLLDFYALNGDRLVFLCWALGEAEVGHWHTLEGGFANREPIDRSELE